MLNKINHEVLEGQELQAAINEHSQYDFYFLSDVDNGTRYGIGVKKGIETGMTQDQLDAYNENLPDAYVCSECDVISSDLQDYGCSNCGNGEDNGE